MTASFACDPAEMTRLKGRHDTLRGTVDETTLPSDVRGTRTLTKPFKTVSIWPLFQS